MDSLHTGLTEEEWLAYVKRTGDHAAAEFPCCICGAWFDKRGVKDVSDEPASKVVVKYLNTTLVKRYLCYDRQCKSTFAGTSFQQLRHGSH
jgi:hypothetical protein